MNFTKLNADTDTQKGAIEGQGEGNVNLELRRLKSKKISTPDQASLTEDNPFLYLQMQSPADVQTSRVIVQLQISTPEIAISSQKNNKLNPLMTDNFVRGGTRKSI